MPKFVRNDVKCATPLLLIFVSIKIIHSKHTSSQIKGRFGLLKCNIHVMIATIILTSRQQFLNVVESVSIVY